MQQLFGFATTDLAVVGTLLAIFILYSLWQGTERLLSLLLALPVAGFLYIIFPYQSWVTSFVPAEVVFLIFTLVILWIVKSAVGGFRGGNTPVHILGVSVVLTLLLIVFSYNIIPIEEFYDFKEPFDTFFESTKTLFWITVLALGVLFML